MPIVLETSEAKSCASFNILEALFGAEKHADAEESESKITTSKVSQGQDTIDQSLSKQEASSLWSTERSSSIRSKVRRVSSLQRDSLMIQNLRKISAKPFDSPSIITLSLKSSFPDPKVLEQLQSKHQKMLEDFNTHMENVFSKLLKFGSMTVDKTRKPITQESVELLLNQISGVRVALSRQRQKLIGTFRQLEILNRLDSELDLQIQNIRLEELHDLQVEVARTGEKIDETNKQMAKARTQYESDISKAAHVREKWFAFQNKILSKLDDLSEMERRMRENRAMLCELLHRKQALREERLQLKRRCRIIDNKPLLRKYDQVVDTIQVIEQYKKKFNSL
ncbi:uncharacterized protein LOC128740316 [Sabethes cyaneus]|uniref:uncharacterized protein LOC128740316 n=1 Tax=Sabethes cyaneus TaxID=53552 RepID=UPI00237D5CCE|nr:uncharacterized protein LOC128740316 [Sabethes cyaneus]